MARLWRGVWVGLAMAGAGCAAAPAEPVTPLARVVAPEVEPVAEPSPEPPSERPREHIRTELGSTPAASEPPQPVAASSPSEDAGVEWVKAHCKLYQPESHITQAVCNPVCPPAVRVWPCPEYECPAGANASWVEAADKQACAMQRGNASRRAIGISPPTGTFR